MTDMDRPGAVERAAMALAPYLPDAGASESERWILWERGVALAKQLRSALARPRDEGPPAPAAPKCGTVDFTAPVGVVGAVRPDGSAEVVLNENGRALYGENMRVVMVPPKPSDTTPPRPVTPDDKREEFTRRALKFVDAYKAYADAIGNGLPRKGTEVVLADKEQHAKCIDLLIAHDAMLAAERGGHDEPDPRGVDREAIEAARHGKGG